MELPKSLTTVTPASKIIAGTLFVILPFITFFAGYAIPKPSTIIEDNSISSVKTTVSPTSSVTPVVTTVVTSTIVPTTTTIASNDSTSTTSTIGKDINLDGNVITFNKPDTGGAAGSTYYTYPVKFQNKSTVAVHFNALDFTMKGTQNGSETSLNYYSMTLDGTACDFGRAKIAECVVEAGKTGTLQITYQVPNVDNLKVTPTKLVYIPSAATNDQIIINL